MKTLLTIIGICLYMLSNAQNGVNLSNAYIRSMLNTSDPSHNKAMLNHVVRNEFTRITKANTNGNFGNYVGISSKDNNLAFAYSFVREKSVLELNVKGGINEGITEIFNSQKLNTGSELGLKYHWFCAPLSSGQFKPYDVSDIKEKDIELKNKQTALILSIKNDSTQILKKIRDKNNELKKLEKVEEDLILSKRIGFKDIRLNNQLSRDTILLIQDTLLLFKRIQNFNQICAAKITDLRNRRDDRSNMDPFKLEQFKLDSLKVHYEIDTLKALLKRKREELSRIKRKIKENEYNKNSYGSEKDLVSARIAIAQHELAVLQQELSDIRRGGFKKDFNQARKKLSKQIRDNLLRVNDVQAYGVKLFWLTFEGNLKNDSFTTFDSALPFESQLSKGSDLIPSASLSATYYANEASNSANKSFGKRHIKFITIGGSLSYGNNLSSLTQVQVQTVDTVSPSRTLVNNQTAYSGEFVDNIATGQLFTDFYQFIGNKDNVGFHIRGTIDFGPQRPITSLRFGLVFAAIKKEDAKSIVNFEAFVGLNDVFDNENERTLFGRDIVGIQTTFPFNFKLKNE